jgi:hypothetical protein
MAGFMEEDTWKVKVIEKQIGGSIPAQDQVEEQFKLPVQLSLDKEKGQHAKEQPPQFF